MIIIKPKFRKLQSRKYVETCSRKKKRKKTRKNQENHRIRLSLKSLLSLVKIRKPTTRYLLCLLKMTRNTNKLNGGIPSQHMRQRLFVKHRVVSSYIMHCGTNNIEHGELLLTHLYLS